MSRARRIVAWVTAAVIAGAAAGFFGLLRQHHDPGDPGWPAWQAFVSGFIQDDGRVVDHTAEDRSTSEGQAYGLFFALVANDRLHFNQILEWTRNNLAQGKLGEELPAWLWGKRKDGSWGVIDANPAADSDLWLAQTLLEAGRLWQDSSLSDLGQAVLWQVEDREVKRLPGVGLMLLPGPTGFQAEDGTVRLNPSYLPAFQLHYLAQREQGGTSWGEVLKNYQTLASSIYSAGLAPDWFALDDLGKPQADPTFGYLGSYDAIRVYLWAALSNRVQPDAVKQLQGMLPLIRAHEGPPEHVDTQTGAGSGGAPLGFSAALLPYLQVLGQDQLMKQQQARVEAGRVNGQLGQPPHYYEQVLALFGEGWIDGRYQFDERGQLVPKWAK